MKPVYSLVGVALATSLPAYGQESSIDHNKHQDSSRLEHVLVSMPAHKKDAKTALPIYRLDGEQLQREAAQNLGDTLSAQPGLSSASFGPAVGQPVIRGHVGPRVQVLQNSLPTLDVSSNSADHAVSAEALLADSIEVLRGPASMLYGGGAIGGVVNIIDSGIPSRHVDGVSAAAELRHNSGSDGRTAISRIDAGNGQWTLHLDALYRDWSDPDIPGRAVNAAATEHAEEIEESSVGYLDNADGLSRQHTVGGAYHFNNGSEDTGYIGISYRERSDNYGIPAGVHAEHHEEEHDEHGGEEAHEEEHGEDGGLRIDLLQKRWDLAGDRHFDGFWELLRWRLTHSDYQHVELEPEEGEFSVGTRFEKTGQAARLELAHGALGPLHGVLGIQYQRSDFSALGEEAFVPPSEHEALGVFVVEDLHFDRLQLEAGLRLDLDSLSVESPELPEEDFFGVSTSIAALYDISDAWLVAVSASQSRRAATAEERYSNVAAEGELVVHGATGVIEVGDTDLGHETSNNFELQLRAGYPTLSAELTLYHNDFADYIYLANSGEEQDETPIYRYQQQNAEFRGAEYLVDWRLPSAWSGGEWTLGVFGDRVSAQLDDGDWLPRIPPRSDGLRLSHRRSLGGGELYAETRWLVASRQNKVAPNETVTDGFHRVDASVSWRRELAGNTYTLLFKARNIADEEIRSSASFIKDKAPEAGRSVEVGLRVELGSS